jgi:hypothetical protein
MEIGLFWSPQRTIQHNPYLNFLMICQMQIFVILFQGILVLELSCSKYLPLLPLTTKHHIRYMRT